MSEHTNGKTSPGVARPNSDTSITRDSTAVDCAGLSRAIALLNAGRIVDPTVLALVRQESVRVQKEADSLFAQLQKTTLELRQLRDTTVDAVKEHVELRQTQNHNDRFVADLIQEYEVALVELRRERDTAIDRVRELSREVCRVATATSSTNTPRVSKTVSLPAMRAPMEVPELKARIEELTRERERSVRLLRQLAEQRDRAEARVQQLLLATGSESAQSLGQLPARTESITARLGKACAQHSPVAESTPQVSDTADSHEHADPEPVVVRVPTLPSPAPAPTPNSGTPDTPDDWDVSIGSDWTDPQIVAELTTGQVAIPATTPRTATLNGIARAQPSGLTNRVGTYSMRTEDLAADAVLVLHSEKKRLPRP